MTRQFGLDRPLPFRYCHWLDGALQGNLGESTLSHQPVTTLLVDALRVTLELALFSSLLALVVGAADRARLGSRNDRRWTRPVMFGITLGISVPGFVTGLMLIIVFSVKLGWFPPGGYVPFTDDPAENLKSMVLPSIALAL